MTAIPQVTIFDSIYAVTPDQINNNFGKLLVGDGSDGAFSASSGNTNLTQGNVYQYTSFSLTGTATIGTTKTTGQPIIILVQGDLIISSSGTCDFSGCGEDSPTGFQWSNGTSGNNDDAAIITGGKPPIFADLQRIYLDLGIFNHIPFVCSGTKGGDGDNSDSGSPGAAGVGGSGGGSIIFIVGGSATISGVTFDMTGDAGTNGDSGGAGTVAQGGGGGGGGSIAILCYDSLTDSGTYSVTGGAGGTGLETGTSTSNGASSGAGGASAIAQGNSGSYSDTSGQNGGAGAGGLAVRKQIVW